MFKLKHAVRAAKRLNQDGIGASISFFPRIRNTPKEVQEEVEEYSKILLLISEKNLNIDLTVKLPQFGILKDPKLTVKALTTLAERAKELKSFIWIDMERASLIGPTLKIFEELYKKYGNLGICLQAYQRRTKDDLVRVLKYRAPVRLVKGFYNDGDITDWAELTKNYLLLMKELLAKSSRPCIATHDLKIIAAAKREIKAGKLKNAEIQFFYCVRNQLARKLVREGFKVRIYIPYGHVLQYFRDGFGTFDHFRQFQRVLLRRRNIK